MISYSFGRVRLRWVAVLTCLSAACAASSSLDAGTRGTGGTGDGDLADARPVRDGSVDSETGPAPGDGGGMSATGGLAGSATGGSVGSNTGGLTGSATGGLTGSATGGLAGSATGGSVGSNTGGLTGSATGGLTGSATGGSVGSNTGGAPGSGGRRGDGGISGQAGLSGGAGRPAGGQSGTVPPGCNLPTTVGFQRDVQPFLMKSCGSMSGDGCHVIDGASTMSSGGYDHAYDWITAGSHASSCPEKPTPFRYQVVMAVIEGPNPPSCSKSRKMPPPNGTGAGLRAPLTECQIATLLAWLNEPLVTQMHRPDDSSPTTPYPMPPFN